MAAIWAARTTPAARVVALDGARTLGAKILVAGGGRCNVTHERVSERDFAGSTPHAIRKVLLRFDVPRTIAFFEEIGVRLKREETGKLFPTTDRARTVLDALLAAARGAGVALRHPARVESVARRGGAFDVEIAGRATALRARRVVLATGGRSLPMSGSDGHGYAIARALGHTITPRVVPALVPIVLEAGAFPRALSGVSTPATVEVRSGSGRRLAAFTGPVLCTHFGLSGPALLDASRTLIHALADDPRTSLVVSWLPGETIESVDAMLQRLATTSVGRALAARLPERLARALCAEAGVDAALPGNRLPRPARRALAAALVATRAPVAGHRGFAHAEATAGGVPLRETRLETMESRACPGLFLCGEICDVDGRIGGFNFQWAWASGYVAGVAAGAPA
jgi:hypothetical protein